MPILTVYCCIVDLNDGIVILNFKTKDLRNEWYESTSLRSTSSIYKAHNNEGAYILECNCCEEHCPIVDLQQKMATLPVEIFTLNKTN